MKILHSSNHKLEEYKGHENSRNMNDETKEGAFSLNFYKFLEGKEEYLTNGSRAITWW